MKKLLALILCVVMVLSLAPAAFAAYDTSDQRVWRGAGQSQDIINALRTNVESMYGSIAADTAVYQTVRGIDDMVKGLVDEMMKGYAPRSAATGATGQAGSVIGDAVKAGLRATIGGEISDYLTKHNREFYKTDALGNQIFDPIAYMGVFAKAASGAVSSEKAIKGIQAYMYYILQRSTYEQVAEDAFDLLQAMKSWGDWGKYGFDDATVALPGFWGVPGTNIDSTMHDVNDIYQEFLTAQGMLGADLNLDGAWDTGFTGTNPIDILAGAIAATDANGNNDGKGTENGESAFITGINVGQ